MKRIPSLLLPALTSIVAVLFVSCGQRKEWRSIDGATWNTLYHISYESATDLTDSILEIFAIVENSLSAFNDSSLVALINTGEEDRVDAHFKAVFDASSRIAEASGGYFDPTIGVLIDAWGFGRHDGAMADSLLTAPTLDSLLQCVGIGECRIEGDRVVKKSAATRFNFSAIAKGYGCDMIGEMFSRQGVENYLLEIGGELAMKGESPRGRDWVVQVDAPVPDKASLHAGLLKIATTDCGVATSGNYRNNRTSGTLTLGHTLNPLTGKPAPCEVLSATILAPTTMEADAIATACMAMPLAASLPMVDSMENIEALMVVPVGTPYGTMPEGWRVLLVTDEWAVIVTREFPTPID